MNNDRTQIYENIKQAISSASRNSQTMEMHLQ
ncbi:transcription factor, partial [Escherichia coli]|nr:transcription factor [Escherichia coli]